MRITRRILFAGLFAMLVGSLANGVSAAERLKLLLIDGQNNHDWKATTPIMYAFLKKTGRFEITVATTPPAKAPAADWDSFRPEFSKFDVVLSNYNGELWPDEVQKSLEKYVAGGGGLVIVHAANNAFPQWSEWNKMIGLGWRDNKFGNRVTVNDEGKVVITPKGSGPGASHGPQHEFSIVTRDSSHPVVKGLPREWMHAKDELYHGQRGPAQQMTVIATAYSSSKKGGSGTNEPMVWWIPYGRGKVFTTVMGHGEESMRCVGFQTIVSRGSEWAATGKVTLPVSKKFPTAEKASLAK